VGAASDKLYKDPENVKEWERVFGLKLDYVKGDDADKILLKLMSPSPGWEYLKGEFIPKLQAKENRRFKGYFRASSKVQGRGGQRQLYFPVVLPHQKMLPRFCASRLGICAVLDRSAIG
jgi:hypothetical protein